MHILLNINQLSSINVAPSGMFSPQSNFAVSDSRTDVFGKVRLFHPDTFCAEFFFKPRVFRDLFRTLQWRAQTAVYAVFRYFVFDPLDIC